MSKRLEVVKHKRAALSGEMNFHSEVVTMALPMIVNAPVYKQPIALTPEEKGEKIQACISAGFIVGKTVIRPHHANVSARELPHLVGKIVGFDRGDAKWEYRPILVMWGRPGNTGGSGPFNYGLNELDLFNYEWKE